MEESGLSLDAGSMDQLDQDFELEFNAEGFDFQIDGTYDQTDELAANTAVITENTTSKPDNDEIGYEDDDDLGIVNDHQQRTEAGEGTVSEETGQENVDDEPEQDTNGDHTGELDLNFEFDEEIGYEDDGVAAAYVSPDSNSPEAAQPAVEQTPSLAEGQLESEHDSRSTSEAEMTTAEDVDAHQDVNVEIEDYEEHESQHDKSSDESEEGDPNLDNRSDIEADESTDENDHERSILSHDENPDSGPSEADKAIQDLANSLPGTPEIEVLYNDVTYMLFGSSDDDPESYFLADTKELDRPLSQFLAAVRQIISNEILPSDVLLISFDSLDLEFGERSNDKFLGRTLRELLDCYAALAARNDDIPPTPALQLIVQHDCEERFLQLRHDAGLRETQSHHNKESDEAENQDSWRGVDQGDEGDEFTDNLDQIERRVASEDVDNAATPNIVANMAPQYGDESDMSTADGHDSTGETQVTDSRHTSAAPASPTPAAVDDLDDENQMEEEDHFVHHENGESTAIEVDNPATTPQEVISSEIYEYTTEQPSIDLINGGFVEDVGFETLDEIVVANGDGVEQITGINGDDVLHAYDGGAELSMILEQEDHAEEEIVVATDAEVNIIHDDGDEELVRREDWHHEASGVSQSATPAASNYFQNATYVAAATDSGSVHTSTTINGDEIDYDEYNPTDGSFNSGDDGQPLTAADGGENDEIDWENDGDEDDDDQVVTDEHSAPQKQQEPSLTSSSLAGKRSRTDEVESLPEGSDHKRRRT